jgi:hypothetical protein
MRARRSKGQSLVEASLVLGAFMGLLLGIASIGQMLFARQTLAARVHEAARWGAINAYDAAAIRNVVRFGSATPESGATPFLGLGEADVLVENPGCPGVECRVSVSIPSSGIRSVEPVELLP